MAFLRYWLVPRALEAATCRSSSVAFRLLFSHGFVFGQVIRIVTSHLLSRWLTLPCCVWYGELGLPFVAMVALCFFFGSGCSGSFPLFDPGSPFLALFCVLLRLAWLGVRRVLRLPFASVRSEVFVGLRFRRSGFWTRAAVPVFGLFGCGFEVW